MTKITKIRGLPGTGKTTMLQRIIEKKLNSGITIEDILCSSFSRATIRAISNKIKEIGYLDEDIKDSFRTLHSFAARTLALKENNYIVAGDYQKFCEDHGIPFKSFYVRTLDEIEGFGAVPEVFYEVAGNIMFRWWQSLKKKCVDDQIIRKEIKQRTSLTHREEMELVEFPPSLLLDLYEEWESYKRRNNKWEYDDPLAYIVLHKIPFLRRIKYMIVDEAQDLSPLQFNLVNIWSSSEECDELIVAGDPYQCIYFFNLADPTLFQNLEGEETLLPISHRVPRLPWENARKVARVIGDTAMGKVEPKDADGSVSYMDYWDVVPFLKRQRLGMGGWNGNGGNGGHGAGEDNSENKAQKNTFLLFRTHKEIERFLTWSFEEGVYPLGMGRHMTLFNYSKNRNIYSLMYKLYKDIPITQGEIRSFIASIPAKYLSRGTKTKITKNKNWMEEVKSQERLFGFGSNVDSDSHDNDNTAYFYSLFRNNGFSIDDPEGVKEIISDPKTKIIGTMKNILLAVSPGSPSIRTDLRVGTFFASKGLEADNVFSFDYFPRRDANVIRDEARLVFVSLTRTSDADYIVSPPGRYDEGLIWDLTA